ncbi:putative glycoside hydrolase [Herpetosiphon sp. NSE202]|uniref:putative glycoside hydrolase n=1 Tax=Herpetosiphon sp. NSE202 TaxID=3351349 RepID=UPI003644BCF6
MYFVSQTKRRLTAGLFGAVALVLAACGSSNPPLTGIVTDSYTQKPVAGVTVQVGEASATTDDAGKWTINEWETTNSLLVQASDYSSATLSLADKTPVNEQTPVEVNLTIRPNTISGVVLDQYSQQPVAGVTVKAGSSQATSGTDGRYKLTNVDEKAEVVIAASDYTSATATLEKQTSYDVSLRPTSLSGIISDKYSQKPVSGATVQVGNATAQSDAEGRYTVRNIDLNAPVVFSATDYSSQTLELPQAASLDVVLRPSTVRGSVVNSETGKPLTKGTVIAMVKPFEGADETYPYTGTAVTMTRLKPDGTYELTGVPENAQIQVLSPGYRKAWTALSDGKFTADLEAEEFVAKAIYITAATGSSKAALTELFDLVDQTEVNAIVLDIKLDIAGEVGMVGYISKHPLVIEADTAVDYLDMEWIVAEARKRNIYLIGRMAVMRDNSLADAHPEWAAQSRVTGGVWEDDGGLKWLDPFNQNVTEYNVGVAKEIADYGFDEVQFDYIRFPSDGSTSNLVFSQPIDPENNPEVMYEAIGDVLKRAHGDINGAGAFFSIDVFGYATWRNMWEIGQSLEIMADHTDYVCAMVYPSHYDRNELGFDNADAHPYEIVKDSIEKGQKRMEGKYAVQRPWLQAFTATWLNPVTEYGRTEVRAQMQAVAEVEGTYGWILWNAANYYDPEWLD